MKRGKYRKASRTWLHVCSRGSTRLQDGGQPHRRCRIGARPVGFRLGIQLVGLSRHTCSDRRRCRVVIRFIERRRRATDPAVSGGGATVPVGEELMSVNGGFASDLRVDQSPCRVRCVATPVSRDVGASSERVRDTSRRNGCPRDATRSVSAWRSRPFASNHRRGSIKAQNEMSGCRTTDRAGFRWCTNLIEFRAALGDHLVDCPTRHLQTSTNDCFGGPVQQREAIRISPVDRLRETCACPNDGASGT